MNHILSLVLLNSFLISSLSLAFEIPDGQSLHLSDPPAALQKVMTGDLIQQKSTGLQLDFSAGYDDLVYLKESESVLVFADDYYIRNVDLKSGRTLWSKRVGMFPAGAKRVPGNSHKVYFCAAKGETHALDQGVQVGLYELDFENQNDVQIRPLITRLPMVPNQKNKKEILYPTNAEPSLERSKMVKENSREFSVCNDLAISEDGKRIYMTEPYDVAGATVGGQFSQAEAFMVTQRGHLWKWDLAQDRVSLVAQNFSFIDGIEIQKTDFENGNDVLLAGELSKFRVIKITTSSTAPTWSVVIDNLPGSPDALTIDTKGNVWVALIKERSKLISWAHRYPALKKILLNLPSKIRPVPKKTGYVVLGPDLLPLTGSIHDGSLIRDIPAIEMTDDGVLFSSIKPQGQKLIQLNLKNIFDAEPASSSLK